MAGFAVKRLLGEGAMGQVFLAEADGQEIALKYLNPGSSLATPEALRQEVKLLSRLSHPHLVKILDFFPAEDRPFFSMEYVPGWPLDEWPGRTDAAQALSVFLQVVRGMGYLHARNILHRDLKPSNLRVTPEGHAKILDFGLSTLGAGSVGVRGTPRYLPPEAFSGEYGPAGDLFSLGVVLYEVLAGRRPFAVPLSASLESIPAPEPLGRIRGDLPSYFCDLIHRLLELSPARRPSSALSVLRYLEEHQEERFPETKDAGFEKMPFIGRRAEMETLMALQAKAARDRAPVLLRLSGPMGVGRSRLLEEVKWNFQIQGVTALSVAPEQASSWMRWVAGRWGAPAPIEKGDVLQRIHAWLDAVPLGPLVLLFCDLQEWDQKDLQELRLLLAKLVRSGLPWLAVLETGEDEKTAGNFSGLESLALGDLSEKEATELVAAADFSKKLNPHRAKKIVEESGGRPLLLLQFLAFGGAESADLDQVCAARISASSEEARDLLALLGAHSNAVPLAEAANAWSPRPSFEDALLELDGKGFLAVRSAESADLRLAHPAMKPAFLRALGERTLEMAHGRWIAALLPHAEKGDEKAVISLAEHAFAAKNKSLLKKWGVKAAEGKLRLGRNAEALVWFENLLAIAETPKERVLLNAHLAPLYYRLGRFEEALKAYDRWFSERADDETRLQRLKHLYYTGLVFFTWGRLPEAKQRLEEGLARGESGITASHRPYVTRAHCAMAAILERESRWEEARRHLNVALGFAGEESALLGEVEQLLGKVDQRNLQYVSALGHFSKSREHYARAGNAQSEEAAIQAEGMALRDRGDLRRAAERVKTAADRARRRGDVLQWARATENLGLILMDRGDYAAARAAFEEAEGVLEGIAGEEDRETVEILRATFALRIGRFDRCWGLLKKMSQRPFVGAETRFLSGLLAAELHYARGEYDQARRLFETEEADLEKNPGRAPALMLNAGIGACRALAAQGKLRPDDAILQKVSALLECLSGDVFGVWRKAFRFFVSPADALEEKDAEELMALIRRQQAPEVRADLYRLLAADLERKKFPAAAKDIMREHDSELQKLCKTLPEENIMDFEKSRAFRSAPSAAPVQEPPPAASSGPSAISEARFRQYGQILRYISQNRSLEDILERVMDAGVELTGAERGFLLLQNPEAGPEAPFPGYDVKSARHLSRRGLKQKEFQLSLSAVKKAVETGTYLLTDDAQLDPRLKGNESVMIHQLKSILIVPMDLEEETIGAIYLDHPFRQGCFSHESVLLLSALASQAALAIQKARLVEALRRSQEKLEARVQDQSQKIETITQELTQMRDQLKFGYEDIVGRSPAIVKVFQLLDHVTDTAIPVWIHGESGTGKELIARALHFNSPRKGKPFVAENCSAIPETLLESELFGHKKGSFTHADRDRIGLFEQANNGTLFLDEIADMSLPMQAKLLRVLQEGEVRPLGSSKTVKVDVRLVTASNRDLGRMVSEGKFRQDLFFRINGLAVRLPPLRERKEDIPLLAQHFIQKFARTLKLEPSELGDAAMKLLLQHPWPGNIRELEGVLRTALLFAKGRSILPEHLNFTAPTSMATGDSPAKVASKSEEESSERQMILDALKQTHLSKEAAAKKLGMGLRTLYTRMGQLGIPKKKTLLARLF